MNEQRSQDTVKCCNDLLAFEYVAIGGYDSAIDGLRTGFPGIAEKLSEFRVDHQRHVSQLMALVRSCCGEPRTTPSADVVFKKPMMAIKALMGAESVLGGMVSNEEGAASEYDCAASTAINEKLPKALITLCRNALEDERKHLAYVTQQYESFRTGTRVEMGADTRTHGRAHPEKGRSVTP